MKKILIVEDDPEIQELLKQFLAPLGELTRVQCVRKALMHLEDDFYDLVITDLNLNDRSISGKEVIDQAIKHGSRVICLTGSGLKCNKSDVTLFKPFEFKTLAGKAKELLNKGMKPVKFSDKVAANYQVTTIQSSSF